MEEINDFCEKLGSISPAPGGGAAAGVTLSVGAACLEKAVRFSLVEKDQKDIINEIVEIREAGLQLSEEDQKAFVAWQDSRKLPKNTEEEKKIRKEKIDFYVSECAYIPYKICLNACKLIDIAQNFVQDCNKWLISDAAIGAILSNAAFESSVFNIAINIPYIKDEKLKNEINEFTTNKTEYIKNVTNQIIIECNKILEK